MGPMCDMCHHLIGRKSKVMDVDKEIQESQWKSDIWQDEASHLTLDQTNSVGRRRKGGKKKEKEEREDLTSLYDLRRLVGRFLSGRELKIICSTKATRGYRKHDILLRK